MTPRLAKIDPVHYDAAQQYAKVVRAFAIIESNEQPYPIGDAGEAFGLLQIHPATFKQHYGSVLPFIALNSDTWIVAEIKCCAGYLVSEKWLDSTPSVRDLIVQAWNLGVHGVFSEGKRNPEYLARWKAAYASIQ